LLIKCGSGAFKTETTLSYGLPFVAMEMSIRCQQVGRRFSGMLPVVMLPRALLEKVTGRRKLSGLVLTA
jgi:hypothetical protein